MADARPTTPQLVLAAAGCAGAAAWFGAIADERIFDPLTLVLAVGAVFTNLRMVRSGSGLYVSASFTFSIVAVALLGPAAAFAIAVASEIGAWVIDRIRVYAVAANALSCGVPYLITGTAFELVAPSERDPLVLLAVLAAVAAAAVVLSYFIASLFGAPTLRDGLRAARHLPSPFGPALLWAVPVAAGVASVSASVPELGLLVLVVTVVGMTYMLSLVASSRASQLERSLGGHEVVAGLLRALQTRDPESARHAAAVAKYASAIAGAYGLPEDQCRAAHAAGLMHDLGRLSLSDVALRAEGALSDGEWQAIQRHPEAGAEMLRGLDVSETVVEAVAAHHERPDGRGYPTGLVGEAIPLLARIVAVAEVYDTLTSAGSYRGTHSSFHALTELRRVAGEQLDAACVEALAAVLAHRPLDDRHATAVDLDAELAIERRLAQAATS